MRRACGGSFESVDLCLLRNSVVTVDATLGKASSPVFLLQLPSPSQLVGTSSFVQFAASARGFSPLGCVTSNGLELVLGDI